jgi:hypothetical protein
MEIRQATKADYLEIASIYTRAREYMKEKKAETEKTHILDDIPSITEATHRFDIGKNEGFEGGFKIDLSAFDDKDNS